MKTIKCIVILEHAVPGQHFKLGDEVRLPENVASRRLATGHVKLAEGERPLEPARVIRPQISDQPSAVSEQQKKSGKD